LLCHFYILRKVSKQISSITIFNLRPETASNIQHSGAFLLLKFNFDKYF